MMMVPLWKSTRVSTCLVSQLINSLISVNLVGRARKCHKTNACNCVVSYQCYRDLIYCCCKPSKHRTPVHQCLYAALNRAYAISWHSFWNINTHLSILSHIPYSAIRIPYRPTDIIITYPYDLIALQYSIKMSYPDISFFISFISLQEKRTY